MPVFSAFWFSLFNTDFLSLISHHFSWFCEYFIILPINSFLLSWPELICALSIHDPVSAITSTRWVGLGTPEETPSRGAECCHRRRSVSQAVLSHTSAPTAVMIGFLTQHQTWRILWILCLKYRRKRHASLSLFTRIISAYLHIALGVGSTLSQQKHSNSAGEENKNKSHE